MIQSNNNKIFFPVFLVAVLSLGLGYIVSAFSTQAALIIVSALLGLFFAFFYTEGALIMLIFSMLLSPEIVIGSLPKQDIIIRLEDIFLFVFTLSWIARQAIDKENKLIISTPINKFIAFYTIIFIFSTGRGILAAGINPLKGTFFVLKYFEYFLIYFLTANIIRNKRQVKRYLVALLLTFAVVNIYAITQIGTALRVSAPFEGAGEPNTLGGYQVLMLAVTIGLLLHSASLKQRFFLVILSALTVLPFIHTLSRASYMAIIPMYLTFVIFEKSKRIFLVSVLIVATIMGFLFVPEKVATRIQSTFIPHAQVTIDPVEFMGVSFGPSVSARIRSWQRILEQWKRSPLFGFGVTGLGFLDAQYIRTLAELGVVGFSAFLLLLVALFRYTVRIYRTTEDPLFKGLAVGFLAGHVGILFHALTANTYIIIRIMEPYWFLAAMVMVIPRLDKNCHIKIKPCDEKKECITNAELLINCGKAG